MSKELWIQGIDTFDGLFKALFVDQRIRIITSTNHHFVGKVEHWTKEFVMMYDENSGEDNLIIICINQIVVVEVLK
jgi:hypothetical protein